MIPSNSFATSLTEGCHCLQINNKELLDGLLHCGRMSNFKCRWCTNIWTFLMKIVSWRSHCFLLQICCRKRMPMVVCKFLLHKGILFNQSCIWFIPSYIIISKVFTSSRVFSLVCVMLSMSYLVRINYLQLDLLLLWEDLDPISSSRLLIKNLLSLDSILFFELIFPLFQFD